MARGIDFVIFCDVPVIYQDRQGRKFYGDIPVARLNNITGKMECVDNPRGLAYAARNRLKYRKRKKHERLHRQRV